MQPEVGMLSSESHSRATRFKLPVFAAPSRNLLCLLHQVQQIVFAAPSRNLLCLLHQVGICCVCCTKCSKHIGSSEKIHHHFKFQNFVFLDLKFEL